MSENKIYGYLTKPLNGDTNNLTADFNYRISKIYKNLLLYYDNETVMRIYPLIYTRLYERLLEGIADKEREAIFSIMIAGWADYEVNMALAGIDPFSQSCILSKGEFNHIQKDIVSASMSSIISDSEIGYANNTVNNSKRICKMHGINKTKYWLERTKASIEVSKCKRIAKKEAKTKALALNK